MKIGTFIKSDETGEFRGRIQTLTLGLDVRVIPNTMKASAKAPDYRAVASTTGAEIGAGWNDIGRESGQPYVSLKLDDPSFASPIWGALTKSESGETNLLWSRNVPRAAETQRGAKA